MKVLEIFSEANHTHGFIPPPAPYGSRSSGPSPYKGSVKVPIKDCGGKKEYKDIAKFVKSKPGMDQSIECNTGDGYETVSLYSKTMTSQEIIKSIGAGTPIENK